MSSRHKHGKKTAAANGRPVQRHYLGVHKRPGGRYDAFITNPAKNTTLWLGTFDTAEKAALVYDSAARQLQGNKAKTNFPNPNQLLCSEAAVPPPSLEVRLSSYSSGDAAAEPMFTYAPAAPFPPEALHLSRSSSYSGRHAAAGPVFMHRPVAPLPSEALGLNLLSYYGEQVAAGPKFMYHPGMINNDIHNNVNMSYETSVGGSSNSGYSECCKSKNLKFDLNFPPQ